MSGYDKMTKAQLSNELEKRDRTEQRLRKERAGLKEEISGIKESTQHLRAFTDLPPDDLQYYVDLAGASASDPDAAAGQLRDLADRLSPGLPPSDTLVSDPPEGEPVTTTPPAANSGGQAAAVAALMDGKLDQQNAPAAVGLTPEQLRLLTQAASREAEAQANLEKQQWIETGRKQILKEQQEARLTQQVAGMRLYGIDDSNPLARDGALALMNVGGFDPKEAMRTMAIKHGLGQVIERLDAEVSGGNSPATEEPAGTSVASPPASEGLPGIAAAAAGTHVAGGGPAAGQAAQQQKAEQPRPGTPESAALIMSKLAAATAESKAVGR